MKASLKRVMAGNDLSRDEATNVMEQIMEGKATPSQMGALLTALTMKGETVEELTAFADVMRKKGVTVKHNCSRAVDTCGTGGDGNKTFNVSTAAAIVVSSLGVPVAKHGNRSVSSKSGSADVLEELGISVQMTSQEAADALEKVNFCFMFAPLFHQSMRHVAATRKELGVRTFFNILGPLTNPAGVKYQLIGVYRQSLTEPMAHVLKKLGSRRALVVASDDGLDEISVSAKTQVSELRDGRVTTYTVSPEQFELPSHPLSAVKGGDARTNASIIRDVLSGAKGPQRDIVVANAAAVLYVTGRAENFADGAHQAKRALDEGLALEKLNELIAYTEAQRHVS